MAKGDKYYHSPFMEESHPLYNRTLELTEDENKDLVARLMGRKEYADSMKVWRNREMTGNNAHENIDTLINHNENKDYFELMKGMMPSMDTVENFVPPFGAIKLAQLATHAHNAPADETSAFLTGLKEAILGEPDPVGPQGIPFSQFMQQKKALNPKVKSIVNQHVDNLFKK